MENLLPQQLLTTGVFLSALTYIGYQLKSVPSIIWSFVERKFLYTTCIRKDDEYLYRMFDLYLKDNHSSQYRDTFTYISDPNAEAASPNYDLKTRQREDFFILRLQGRRVAIKKTLEKITATAGGYGSKGRQQYNEEYHISGFFAKKQIEAFLQDVYNKYTHTLPGKSTNCIYLSKRSDWDINKYKDINHVKPLSEIFVDAKDDLVQDLKTFFAAEDWYRQRHLAYRRGYVLKGLPGNGKSALILALAREFNKRVYSLTITPDMDMEDLGYLLGEVAEGSFVLFEDVDATFLQRENAEGSKLSFSSFLNILDGPASRENLVFFFTTNHIEKLDPALLRPGRVDQVIEITNPSGKQIMNYLRNFYQSPDARVSEEIFKQLKNRTCSMSLVQEFCVTSPTLGQAAQTIAEYKKPQKLEVNETIEEVDEGDRPLF